MKIISLEVENLKRIKAIRIKPSGNAIVIGGENDQGKSSALDAIEYLFAGKRAQCEAPVRDGKKKAIIVGELEDLVVKRTINFNGGTYLTVTNKDGASRKSPQTILDQFIGALSFDPLAFTKMDKKAQVETLKKLVGLDFTEHDEKIEDLLEKRRTLKYKARDLQGKYNDMPEYPEVPEEELSISDLLNELGDIQAKNLEIKQKLREYNAAKDRFDNAAAALITAKENFENAEKEYFELKATCENVELISEEPIRGKIAVAEKINKQIRDNKEAQAVKKEWDESLKKVDDYSEKIKEISAAKDEALKKVIFPIEGLSFDESGVTYNGLPFSDDQIGSAARLKVSVAMGLALNPKLKVLLIRDGSLLDENSLKTIAEMASKEDAQLWIERVGKGKECQVIIEDGEIKPD